MGRGDLVAATPDNGNVLVAGVYVTEESTSTRIRSDTADGNGTDNFDFLSKASQAIGAPMNYFVVASAASVMPEITPIKAHNVDLGTGAFLASASNPARQPRRSLRQDQQVAGPLQHQPQQHRCAHRDRPDLRWQHGHRGGRGRRDHRQRGVGQDVRWRGR